MITLTIDGHVVTVKKGASILSAAERAGVRIPTLCHDGRLIPFGACRICIVEERGREGKFIPACFTPAREGMDIVTDSEGIRASRRKKLELLLLNHPMDCPACDRRGNCDLQTLVYEYGLGDTIYPWEKITFAVDDVSPFIRRDPNKCILCGKCVRICDELQGRGALAFIGRGLNTRIGTSYDQVLACEFCGQCIDVCPVGALTSSLFDYETRWWELKEQSTVCGYCGCGCTLMVGCKEGKIKRVESDPGRGDNGGNLCVKGRFGWEYVHSPLRLTSPLVKKGGTFSEVSWEEALEVTARTLREIKDSAGGDALAGIASGRLTNEEGYLFQKFMRGALASNHIGHAGGFGFDGLLGLRESLGSAATTTGLSEIREADVIMLVRCNPYEMHPLVKIELNYAMRDAQPRVILMNPVNCRMSHPAGSSPLRTSPRFLHHTPGTEIALINSMVQVIIEEDLIASQFVQSSTEGWEGLKKQVENYTPDAVEKITGIEASRIRESARTFAQGATALSLLGPSWGFPGDEYHLAIALANLALVTGNVGKRGSGIYYLSDRCNSQGALDMGVVPHLLPGQVSLHNDTERKRFEALWKTELPPQDGMGALEIYQAAERGRVRGLYLVGDNPLATCPGYDQTVRALAALDFLVVQELFLTETARHARVVLPACCFAEKEGTYTALDRRVQKLKRLLPPPGGCLPDGTIFMKLSGRLGFPLNYALPGEVMEEITNAVPSYGGISYQRLERGGLSWPCSDAAHPGTPRLYQNGFNGNRAKLIPVEAPPPLNHDAAYPFTLLTGGLLFHSGSLSMMSLHLKKVCPSNYVEINRGDAARLGIAEGEEVVVRSRSGEVALSVTLSERPFPGVVFMPHHFSPGVALLTSKEAGYTRVAVEKKERIKVR